VVVLLARLIVQAWFGFSEFLILKHAHTLFFIDLYLSYNLIDHGFALKIAFSCSWVSRRVMNAYLQNDDVWCSL
jgi:hypothetical protein